MEQPAEGEAGAALPCRDPSLEAAKKQGTDPSPPCPASPGMIPAPGRDFTSLGSTLLQPCGSTTVIHQ